MKALRAAVVAVAFGMLAGSLGGQTPGGGGSKDKKLPSITLTATAGTAKIQTSGTLDLADLTFKKITVFAANQSGGIIYTVGTTTAPTGQTWPSSGTLDLTSVSDGDYNVWAVLEVTEEPTFYGSALKTTKVGNGGAGSGSYVFWSGNGPVAGQNATITGDGTYSRPEKMVTVDVQMMVIDSAGGPFQVKSTTRNELVNPWTWTSGTYTVTADRTYNAFAIQAIEPAKGEVGFPAQYSASVKQVAVPK